MLPTSRKIREKWGILFFGRACKIKNFDQISSTLIFFVYFFFMFIGLLLSWQSPECKRDLRSE